MNESGMSEEAVAGTEGRQRRAPRRGDTPFDRALREMRERGSLLRVTGLRGASQRVAASHLIRAHGDRPVLYITADSRAADAAKEALQGLLGEREGESRIRSFPRHDTLPFDRFSPQPFVVAQRMEVLHRLDRAGLELSGGGRPALANKSDAPRASDSPDERPPIVVATS